ncbi:MAG: lipopolysaccharide heptosyltransferase II [Candidatus Tectomicrobia bacterium]|uniref:lipopolysaccharide heptosyltransferase II n=1 Tax=Tectimicrobiota bacterium TaxID=2528274 RepID=A0A932GSL7_UNCTE|nr:lipopolysaccharide heptosyltransferase II [Candidatus Tectomicrobia bacterium]
MERIAVWLPNWIGDVVLSFPALKALKELYPRARVVGIVRREICGILKDNPDVDAVYPWDRRSLRQTMGLLLSLRACRFDLALVLPNSWKSAFLARLSGARRRLGYDREGRGFLLSDPVACPPQTRNLHHADYFLNLIRSLGWGGTRPPLTLAVEEDARDRMRDYLRVHGLDGKEPLVAVHPGASKSPRGWAVERFGEVCRELWSRQGTRSLVLGTAEEGREWAGVFQGPGVFLAAGQVALEDLPALLGQCDLFLGNDSGIMHVAAAVGTPVVGIFGPGTAERTGPVLDPDRYRVVSKRFPCSPCRQKFFKECMPAPSGKPYCLEEIGVDEVVRASQDLLKNAAARRSPLRVGQCGS